MTQVDRFLLEAEATWIRHEKGIEQERRKLKERFPDTDLDSHPALLSKLSETLHVAFDRKRLRYSHDQRNVSQVVKVWDGDKLLVDTRDLKQKRQTYWLDRGISAGLEEPLADFCFPWNPEPAFWWKKKAGADEPRNATWLDKPQAFSYRGRKRFHGTLCHELLNLDEYLLVYIDVQGGRIIGQGRGMLDEPPVEEIVRIFNSLGFTAKNGKEVQAALDRLRKEKKTDIVRKFQELLFVQAPRAQEWWSIDYQELGEFYFPMKQGQVLFGKDDKGNIFEDTRRVFRITKVEINSKLPDALFRVEMKNDVSVYDKRYDPPLSYKSKANRTRAEWDAILAEAKKQAALDAAEKKGLDALVGKPALELPIETWFNCKPLTWADLKGKVVILEFWSVSCAPCMDHIPNLKGMHDRGSQSKIRVIGVHARGVQVGEIKAFLGKRKIEYPVWVDTSQKTESDFGPFQAVRRMPYTILVDQHGRIVAHGSLDDLLPMAHRLAKN